MVAEHRRAEAEESGSHCDELLREGLRMSVGRLEDSGVGGAQLRERKHLDPALKEALGELTGTAVWGKQLVSEHFPGVGPVDLCVVDPPMLLELKWSYDETRSKIFESLWDAVKLALLCGEPPAQLHPHFKGTPAGYVVTSASTAAWRACECAELFEDGRVDPREMWSRPLVPPGPNGGGTIGEDLILGSPSSSRPLAAPARLLVRGVTAISIGDGYELRTARVSAQGPVTRWD
jgi:hypothetical protein